MARPQTVTDDEIFRAAREVIARRGADSFTLSEVAAEVGLSRAAIILRFKSTHALKVRLMTQMVDGFCHLLGNLPKTPSGDHLLELAAFIGARIQTPQSLSAFFIRYNTHMQDDELAKLEIKRGEALREAISRIMPKTAISHEAAVNAFSAHLTGSIMAWPSLQGVPARTHLVQRTMEWLALAGISFSRDVADTLLRPETKVSTSGSNKPSPKAGTGRRATSSTASKNK